MSRNIRHGVPPPLSGAMYPGAVRLYNMITELTELYARVATKTEERYSPNTRMGQRLMTWLNRYQVDRDRKTKGKPPKNKVVSFALAKWRPPAWVSARGKSKHEEM